MSAKAKGFRISRYSGPLQRRLGRASGDYKTFRAALRECERRGARCEWVVIGSRGQAFYLETLLMYGGRR